MLRIQSFLCSMLLFVVLVSITIVTVGQDNPPSPCENQQIRSLIREINELRVTNNQLPFVANPILCVQAQTHLQDLLSRPVGELGDIYRRDDEYLHAWLEDTSFNPYPDEGYLADIFVYIARDTPPTDERYGNIVRFLYNQQNTFDDMIRNQNYREVGVAYNSLERDGVTRYNYVFIFGAQPNVLPIIPITENRLTAERARTIDDDPFIGLLIHNENFARTGARQGGVIGSIQFIRDAESPFDLQACPIPGQELVNGWQRFEPTNVMPYSYRLSGSLGTNEIFVQLCDGVGNSTISQATVNYQGGTFVTEQTPTEPPRVIIVTETPNVALDQESTNIAATAMVETQSADLVITETANANATATAEAGLIATETQQALRIEQTAGAIQTATAFEVALGTRVQETINAPITLTAAQSNRETQIADQITATFTNTPTVTPTLTPTPTNTSEPTATDTPEPPTATFTPEPPTATFTLEPPTATNTLEPPTATNTPTPTSTPLSDVEVPFSLRLYWDTQYLVIYNPTEETIRYGDLRLLELDNDEVRFPFTGDDIIRVAGSSNFTIAPRNCMIVFNGANIEIPTLVNAQNIFDGCEGNVLAGTIGIGPDRMPWLSQYTTFNVSYDEELIAQCSVSDTSCSLPQATLAPIEPQEVRGSGETLTIAWTPDILILWNRSDEYVDVSGIAFEVGTKRFTWNSTGYNISESILRNIEPGHCLLAYSFAAFPEDRPETYPFSDFNCANDIDNMIAAGVASNNIVWDRPMIPFQVYFNEVELELCSGTRCEFQLP